MATLAAYLVVGVITLELVRPADSALPPGGILRVVFLWPIVVLGVVVLTILDRFR